MKTFLSTDENKEKKLNKTGRKYGVKYFPFIIFTDFSDNKKKKKLFD